MIPTIILAAMLAYSPARRPVHQNYTRSVTERIATRDRNLHTGTLLALQENGSRSSDKRLHVAARLDIQDTVKGTN